MTQDEINGEYEYQTGEVIIKTFEKRGLDRHKSRRYSCIPTAHFAGVKTRLRRYITPWCLRSALTWGLFSRQLAPQLPDMQPELLDKHYLRKHGRDLPITGSNTTAPASYPAYRTPPKVGSM
ncbi:L-ribulose-5-phosphate 4-epimerase [Salmonella enterica subsp. salamae]|uniref:L-ribulose-5-phosphate 4-epimerase n=1 Tax=Salmonella enterica subsp. salamae TaxID=59202 RepID=A0A6D2G397_SALER|nr:L-ribulose-5-phosphate 4-epimerase [Salmonella enterica subsp. salamae]